MSFDIRAIYQSHFKNLANDNQKFVAEYNPKQSYFRWLISVIDLVKFKTLYSIKIKNIVKKWES